MAYTPAEAFDGSGRGRQDPKNLLQKFPAEMPKGDEVTLPKE